MIRLLVLAFPVWALLFSALAFSWPALFAAHKAVIVPLLALVMFGMGLTLEAADFRRVAERPGVILVGVVLQYALMPLIAWGVGATLDLEPALLAGMILVGASPGGTASNVICYLARGDVALSISLTAVSTLLSIVLTPVLCALYMDVSIEVPVGDMLVSILQMVLAPVLSGVMINRYFHRHLRSVQALFPLVSVLAIAWIIGIIVALNAARFEQVGIVLLVAVMAHNLLGLAGGYALAHLLGYGPVRARTLAIEVGMQNSGLAVALAVKFFTPLAALPGAVFSIWHNLSGSLLAAGWRRAPR